MFYCMAQLLVRKLDESLVALLKKRAAKSGRSTEEEHRLILREVLTGVPTAAGEISFKDYLVAGPQEELDLESVLLKRNVPSERKIDL